MDDDNDDKNARTNVSLKKVAPELESEYAQYPMKREKWLPLSQSVPNDDGTSEPAFIPHKQDKNFPAPLKKNYVHGKGPKGYGYYHLLTKTSYIALNNKLQNKPRPGQDCCCFPASTSPDIPYTRDDYEVASDIIYYRSVATIPDDMVAYNDAVGNAAATATMHYQMGQY